MILRKTLLAVSAVVLLSTPAWALANQPSDHSGKHAPSTTPVGPPATTPNNTDNPGVGNGSQNGDQGTGNPAHPEHPSHPRHPGHPETPKRPGKPEPSEHPAHPGKPHKCMAHNVAYIVSGTLVSQALSKNADGTYSGTVTVSVAHTNRHAAAAKGMTETYTLTDAHPTLALRDTNNDGSVGLDDLAAGDRVKAIGKITTLSKKCDQSKFTSQTTIREVIFHVPR